MSDHGSKRPIAWPKPLTVLAAFVAVSGLLAVWLASLGRGAQLLNVLVPPILLTAIHYRRSIYLTMLLWLVALSIAVTWAAPVDHYFELEKILIIFLAAGTMAEVTHRLMAGQAAAENALRASRRRLQSTLEAVQSGIVTIDPQDGKVLDANPAALEMAGLARSDLIGSPYTERVHPQDQERVWAAIVTEDPPEGSDYLEYRYCHADGRYLWLETTSRLLPGEQGQPAGYVLGSRDITDRKLAEQALIDSESKYRTLFNTIADPIFICDVQTGRILDCNQSAVDRYGWSREELAEMNLDQLSAITPTSVTQRRSPSMPTELHLTRDGKRLEVEIHTAELEIHGQRTALHVVRDVTARNRIARVQAALYQIASAAITADNLDELYRLVHAILGKLIPTENYFIALYDAETDVLSFPYFIDQCDPPPGPRKPGRGLTDYVMSTGEPLLANPEKFVAMEAAGLVESRGTPSLDWLGVPLIVGNRTIGVMVVQTYSEGVRFGQEDLDILTFVSSQVAMTIERKRADMALRQSENSLAEAQRLARLGNYQFSLSGGEVYLSEETFRIFSRDPAQKAPSLDELVELIHPDDQEAVRAAVRKATEEDQPFDIDFRILDPSGTVKFIYCVGQPVLGPDGRVARFFGTLMDITERKRAEDELRQAHARLERHSRQLAHILDTSYTLRINLGLDSLLDEIVQATSGSLNFGAVILNLIDDETGLVRVRTHFGLDEDGRKMLEGAAYTSEDLQKLFQERFQVGDCYFIPAGMVDWDEELSGPTYSASQAPAVPEELDDGMWHPDDMLVVPILLHEGQVSGFISVDRPLDGRRPDRDKLRALAIFTNQAAAAIENARLYERAQKELAERKRAEERLWILSTHDTLTGLYNRAYFESEMLRLKPDARFSVSVVMADVDDLKTTNDRLGHAAGDDLLRRAAKVLKVAFRAEDVIARIGGDEFAVLLPGADAAAAQEGINRVVSGLAAHNARYPGIPLHLSVGSATADHRTTLDEALRLADTHMYHAKQANRKERRAAS